MGIRVRQVPQSLIPTFYRIQLTATLCMAWGLGGDCRVQVIVTCVPSQVTPLVQHID